MLKSNSEQIYGNATILTTKSEANLEGSPSNMQKKLTTKSEANLEGCPNNLQKQKSKLKNELVRLTLPLDECQPKLKSLKEELYLRITSF